MTMKQVGWPLTGGKAFDYQMEVALDGVTFKNLCSGDVYDLPITLIDGTPTDTFNMTVGPIPGVGLTTRKLRLSWVFAKALTISGTMQAA